MSNGQYTALIVKGESISVTIAGKTTTIPSDAPNFDDLCALVKRQAPVAEIEKVLTPAAAIKTVAAKSGFEIRVQGENIGVFVNGVEIHSKVAKLIEDAYLGGTDIEPIRNFMIKAMSNRDAKEVDVLYDFVTKNKLPIHPDGDFLAFKATRPDGFDHHSGTVEYKVGEYVHVVNANPDKSVQCSTGLHIGGSSYVSGFHAGRSACFILKVNPADTIYYRSDAGQGKMRVSKLFVYARVAEPDNLAAFLPFMIMSSPEGDALEAVAKNAPVGTKKTGQKKSSLVVKQAAKGTNKKERKVVKAAKAAQTFVTKVKNEITFKAKDGKVFTAAQVLEGVKAHGQRGWSAMTGVARTTIQSWLDLINGSKRGR